MNFCRANAGGFVGTGCVGQDCSPGTSLLGTGRSSIGHSGSPVTRSNTNTKPDLVGLSDNIDHLSVVPHRQQLGSGRGIVIPQIVMHRLKMPEPFAGAQIEREQAIAEEIRSHAVRAVPVVGRRSQREVADGALLVDGDLTPGIDAADVFPGVGRPRLIAELPGTRHGVEGPEQLSGQHVVCPDVSGGRPIRFTGRRPENDHVPEHMPRRAGLDLRNGLRIASQSFPQIHAAVVSE